MSRQLVGMNDRWSRRSFLSGSAAAASLAAVGALPSLAEGVDPPDVRALTFDMQGTVFDFYDPLLGAAKEVGRRRGLAEGWAATLPGDWSDSAHAFIIEIASGRRPWVPNIEVYRETLTPLLAKRGVAARITGEDVDALLGGWGKMVPWPDAVEGIGRLRRKYTMSTLTNASMAQMTALVKSNKLPFDEILTGELSRAFKPDPKVYRLAVDYVGFPPDQLMMVSAHKWDLKAAKGAGFRTAYVPRPSELGPGRIADRNPESFIDIIAADLMDLAAKLDT